MMMGAVAMHVAMKHINTLLTWGEPPDQVAAKIAAAKEMAQTVGKDLKFGIRRSVAFRLIHRISAGVASQQNLMVAKIGVLHHAHLILDAGFFD